MTAFGFDIFYWFHKIPSRSTLYCVDGFWRICQKMLTALHCTEGERSGQPLQNS